MPLSQVMFIMNHMPQIKVFNHNFGLCPKSAFIFLIQVMPKFPNTSYAPILTFSPRSQFHAFAYFSGMPRLEGSLAIK